MYRGEQGADLPEKYSRRSTLILLHIARFMRRLPRDADEHFVMESWFEHNGSQHLEGGLLHGKPVENLTSKDLLNCGTTACAAGWAASMPAIKALGFCLRPGAVLIGESSGSVQIAYAGKIEWDAIEAFFGDVPEDDLDRLFMDVADCASTPADWADLAEELVAEHGAKVSRLDRLWLSLGILRL
jgi:hypothetical protein